MKYSVGDEFKIKVSQVFENEEGPDLYRINDFKSLVFDEDGLDRLEPVYPGDYDAALQTGELYGYRRLWQFLGNYLSQHTADELKAAIETEDVDTFISSNQVVQIHVGDDIQIKDMMGTVSEIVGDELVVKFKLNSSPASESTEDGEFVEAELVDIPDESIEV